MISSCAMVAAFVTASTLVSPVHFDGLDQEQTQIYERITMERFKIYVTSMVLGAVIGHLVYRNTKNACQGVMTMFTVSYFVYRLWPKTTYMIEHLREDQIDQWLEIYKTMSFKYHMGFLIGLFGFMMTMRN